MPFNASVRGTFGPQSKKPVIGPQPPVWQTFSPTTAPSGGSYSYQLVATDDSGEAPQYSLVSGSLPSGITLTSSGLLTGTATVDGTYNFTVRATDGNGSGTNQAVTLVVQPPYPQGTFTTTFEFTGGVQTWTRPDNGQGNITLTIEAYGASGGRGGAGGYAKGTLNNAAVGSNTFSIYVGGQGTEGSNAPGGFNGGGATTGNRGNEGSGGGASDVRFGSSLSNRIIVAGGGGGSGGYAGAPGGQGGGLEGEAGGSGQGGGGGGGTQTSGGSAGFSNGGSPATSGSFGVGGTGGFSWNAGGGGGGGGWYGGGGGGPDDNSCCADGGGGGGGSNYARTDIFTNITHTRGTNTGNGRVVFTYTIV